MQTSTSTKVLYWTARILSILAILLVSLFLWEKESYSIVCPACHNYQCMEMGKSRRNNIDHFRISI